MMTVYNNAIIGICMQGRANVQISCVPDDSAALLGPNGTLFLLCILAIYKQY
jgi:hypothetical protein